MYQIPFTAEASASTPLSASSAVNKCEIGVHGCLCPDEMVVRMRKIMAKPRSWYVSGGEETRSGTEKRYSHNLQSGHPAWWSADNCSIFLTVNIFRPFRGKKRTGRGNQKCLKN